MLVGVDFWLVKWINTATHDHLSEIVRSRERLFRHPIAKTHFREMSQPPRVMASNKIQTQVVVDDGFEMRENTRCNGNDSWLTTCDAFTKNPS